MKKILLPILFMVLLLSIASATPLLYLSHTDSGGGNPLILPMEIYGEYGQIKQYYDPNIESLTVSGSAPTGGQSDVSFAWWVIDKTTFISQGIETDIEHVDGRYFSGTFPSQVNRDIPQLYKTLNQYSIYNYGLARDTSWIDTCASTSCDNFGGGSYYVPVDSSGSYDYDVNIPFANSQRDKQYILVVAEINIRKPNFWDETQAHVDIDWTQITPMSEKFCDVELDGYGRGDAYCKNLYGASQGGFCDDNKNKCVDSCAGCSSDTSRCLGRYMSGSDIRNAVLAYGPDLCVPKIDACTDILECRELPQMAAYRQPLQGQQQSDGTVLLSDKFSAFGVGVHCEKEVPTNSKTAYLNQMSGYKFGTCEPGVKSPEDCDYSFTKAENLRWLDTNGNINKMEFWAITYEGYCYASECYGGRGVICEPRVAGEEANCITRNVGPGIYGYVGECEYKPPQDPSTICSTNSDCIGLVPSGKIPVCFKNPGATTGYCIGQTIPSPIPVTTDCREQTIYPNDGNSYCLSEAGKRATGCTKPVCDQATGDCKFIQFTCINDVDCRTENYPVGSCINGCCSWEDSGVVTISECGDGICNKAVGEDLFTCPEDCNRTQEALDLITIAVSILLGIIGGFVAYTQIPKSNKNKPLIMLTAFSMGSLIGYLVITGINIPNVPLFRSCNSIDIFCHMENLLRGVISVILGAISMVVSYTFLSSKIDGKNRQLIAFGLSVIIGLAVGILYFLNFVIGLILMILTGVMLSILKPVFAVTAYARAKSTEESIVKSIKKVIP